ncbi:MAG: hypothetical protein C0436_03445 [Alphaproteobacteria bacterium]|nr:hypothetical protein [Alphaproteobacteria bacterium]
MAIQRISNVALFNSTMRDISKTQVSLFDLQQQISSGIKSRDFKGLNGQVEQFVGLEVKINKIDMYLENNQISSARLQTASKSLDSIIDITDSIEDFMVAARSPATSTDLNFVQQIKDKLQAVADSMNVTFEGRYLFSGMATDTKPVPTVPVANSEFGVPDDNYYAGADVSTSLRADDDVTIAFPVRGDDEAFQKLFASVNIAIKAYENKSDSGMQDAITMIQDAQDKLSGAQGRIGSAVLNLEQITDRQTQLKLYWKGVTEQISKTDIVSATSKVANDQAVLQASYQVFARLVQLKLSDYL